MKAIFDFGNTWLKNSNKLTLHDPLAAVSVFYPDICRFERGFVAVETEKKENMGGTYFTSSTNGNVEIARTVDKEKFYHILTTALCGKQRIIPPPVVSRAKSVEVKGDFCI